MWLDKKKGDGFDQIELSNYIWSKQALFFIDMKKNACFDHM